MNRTNVDRINCIESADAVGYAIQWLCWPRSTVCWYFLHRRCILSFVAFITVLRGACESVQQQHLPTVHKLKSRDAAIAANEQARLNALLAATFLANTSESVVLSSSTRGSMKPVDFTCSFCARQFQRALHLEEHEVVTTKSCVFCFIFKMFVCVSPGY